MNEFEIDLKKLETLAEERWADNWNFRAYLRKSVDPERVDAVVHRLNAEVAPRIDCLRCANCCRQISPHLTDADIGRLAAKLGVSDKELIARDLEADGEGEHVFRKSPCPMLSGPKCGVYDARPEDCASFPHLHKSEFLRYSISTIENYRVCPIIYHVFERLKTAFGYDPRVDYIGDEDQETN